MRQQVSSHVLSEMKTYYEHIAEGYDDWFYCRGRHDHGPELNARWFKAVDDAFALLDSFCLEGDILELAPGTGIWTQRLLLHARTVTAVDASAHMLEVNHAKIADDRVSYIEADLFQWQPPRTFDGICFSYWISHVPYEMLDTFLHMVASALRPGGKVFFIDDHYELPRVLSRPDDKNEQVMTRKFNGSEFHVVKNLYEPAFLVERFAAAGLAITMSETDSLFMHGCGTRVAGPGQDITGTNAQ